MGASRCLMTTDGIRDIASKFPNENIDTIKADIALWQEKYDKNEDEYPAPHELNKFIKELRLKNEKSENANIKFEEDQDTKYQGRTIKNASADATIAIAVDFNSRGEKLTKSSVLNQGKKYIPIDANDLSVTQERVDEIVSELNSVNTIKTPNAKGKMTFAYGINKRNDVTSNTTLEAIKNGERTATTRYESDGHIDYWKKLKIGDIIEWEGQNGEKVLVEVTKPLHKLVGSGKTSEQWSKLEGWSVEYFNNKVKPKLNEAWQIEYKYLNNKGISLNIAGNGIYTMKGKYTQQQVDDFTYELLKQVLNSPKLINKIESIRTGGQTGFDEAGAKAGIRLGIPTTILAPKGWTFRNANGQDISDEQQFKERFNNKTKTIETSKSSESSKSPEVPKLTNLDKQNALSLTFDSMILQSRVKMIGRLFTNQITASMNQMSKDLQDRIDNATDQDTRDQLKKELAELTRFSVVKKLTPKRIYDFIKQSFEGYINDTLENRINAELTVVNKDKRSANLTDEQKLGIARKKAEYKTSEYQKLVNNFEQIAIEVNQILRKRENFVVDPNQLLPRESDLAEGDEETGEDFIQESSGILAKEESKKDGWMNNARHTPARESLSQDVRRAIESIPKLSFDGKIQRDDLDQIQYLDGDTVHAVLIDHLRNMITSDDMIPMLEDLTKTKPWAKKIIKLVQEDDALFSQFYQDFRKDFTNYWIQKKKLQSDGTFKIKTISVNKPEGIYYLLEGWRDNYESGTQLDDDSIYEKNGDINKENADKGLKWVNTLNNKFSNLNTEERLKLLDDPSIWETLVKLLKMIGIDPNENILRASLFNIRQSDQLEFTDPIMLLLPQLNIIFSGAAKGNVEANATKDIYGDNVKGDLINTFASAYNSIALMIAEVQDDAVESSFRENDKSYYSYVTPNYLGTLIKRLKNATQNQAAFEKFMNEEYKNYEWFFKDGVWRNDWLEQLENSQEMRDQLDHHVILNLDKIEYDKWGPLDYILVMLNEYWAIPDNKSSKRFAWYHVPILSDTPSAEFIKFRRYVSGVEFDKVTHEKLSYQDIILEKMVNLVNQEYDRIMQVKERDYKYHNGDKSVEPIANYDIIRDRSGNIINKGGSEFKFLPKLNYWTSQDNRSFLEIFEQIRQEGNGEDLKNFIKSTLQEIMDEGFEEEYLTWNKIGLFEETPNGKYKNIPFYGQTNVNRALARNLKLAKEALGDQWTIEMENLLKDVDNNRPFNDKDAKNTLSIIRNILESKQDNKILDEKYSKVAENLTYTNNAKDALREYYWNSEFATSQIIQITTTDIAYYKNMEDFQKRYKQIHSPASRLNTNATYKGEKIGRKFERTIYLSDEMITSTALADIEAVLNQKMKNDPLTKDYILTKLGKYNKKDGVNVADGQAYRSLSSRRAVAGMAGKWDDAQQKAYENFMNDTWDINDFNVIWQIEKPFLATQVGVNSGLYNKKEEVYEQNGQTYVRLVDDLNNPIMQKVPVQNKNSEFLLLAMHELIAGNLGKSSKLKAINRFMEDYNIDVAQFESTVKNGKQGVINISDDEIAKEMELLGKEDVEEALYSILKKATGFDSGNMNPNVVHELSYEDYGIQTATPEHLVDATQLIGTQIRKLVTADISEDAILGTQEMFNLLKNFGGDTILPIIDKTVNEVIKQGGLTKKQWLDMYNAINTENIIQSFVEINEIFKDPKKIEQLLIDEIMSSERYDTSMIDAVRYDETTGSFNIPLFDPVHSQLIQNLLNSVIKGGRSGKSGITKQKIKGGSLIQVSDYGLTDQLSIVFKDKDGNNINWESYQSTHKNATREQYEKWANEAREKGDIAIAYFEAYMPAYSKEFFEPLMTPGTHVLDINKLSGREKILPEELRKLIGYRVPTEDKYSMVPIYIKGFLPQQNGSAIMLPAEITTIAGSDFDIDKLYVMLPEFKKISKYNIGKAWKDFYEDPDNQDIVNEIDKNLGIAFADYQRKHPDSDLEIWEYWESLKEEGIKKYQFSKTAQQRFKEWYNSRKENYHKSTVFSKVNYNFSKAPQDNNLQQRNNLIIDLMYSVLTNSDTVGKILNPGGFDEIKRVSKVTRILDEFTEAELEEALINLGVTINKKQSIAAHILEMDDEKLGKILSKSKKVVDPLAPSTQLQAHQQNMNGANLVPIYANHNANHALIQHTELAIIDDIGGFRLNGKHYLALNRLTDDNGKYISKKTAEFLSSAVDNGKNPVLANLNQNLFTADISMLLSRLGYDALTIGLLMKQPIIMDIVEMYVKEGRTGKYKDLIIEDILKKYKELAQVTSDITYDNYKNNKFLNSELADNIIIAKEITNITNDNLRHTSDFRKLEFYSKQVSVGYLFKRILMSSDALSNLVQAIKVDTDKGAAGPTIADTVIKIQKVTDLEEDIASGKFPLMGAKVLTRRLNTSNIANLRQNLLKSKLPYVQAFYTLGLEGSNQMLSKYFPHFTDPFNDVIDALREMTKKGKLDIKTMNNVYNDLLAYIMSKTEFFGSDDAMTSEEKRNYFINQFPKDFVKIRNDNPDIANLGFIKRLKIIEAGINSPVDSLVFKNVGKLSTILKSRYMKDWEHLMYSDNPEAQKLALNLFRYSYYRNGFAFGPSTFSHLIPLNVRKAVPNYIETLRTLLNSKDDYILFVDQYIYNHLDNRKLVPEISNETTVKFVDGEGNILNEVVFNINDNTKYVDKKVVLQEVTKNRKPVYTFFKYITKKEKGQNIYYKLAYGENHGDYSKAVYRRIKPLGFKNNNIEYEYGIPADEMTSQIEENDYTKPRRGQRFISEDQAYAEADIDSYYEDDTRSYDVIQDSTSEENSKLKDLARAMGVDENYFGGFNNSKDDFINRNPNEGFKDAEDQTICL